MKAAILERHNGLRSVLSSVLKGVGIDAIEVSNIRDIYDCDFAIADFLYNNIDIDMPMIIMTPFDNCDHYDDVYYIKQPFEINKLYEIINKIRRNKYERIMS